MKLCGLTKIFFNCGNGNNFLIKLKYIFQFDEIFCSKCATCFIYFLTDFYFQIRARNFERVEKLFQRCLMKVLNIELWKTYLTYVKDTKASLANYK